MAEEKKEDDIFAEEKPNGQPAYPKWVHTSTGETYPNGQPVVSSVLVQNADEHKAHLAGQKGAGKKEEKQAGWK